MLDRLTNKSIRKINRENIIRTIIMNQNVLRNQLSEKNGISVVTVKNIVDDLVMNGIVKESVCEANFGRKPKSLRMADDLGVIICISLASHDFLRYVIYDIYGTVLQDKQRKIQTEYSYEENLDQLIAQIRFDEENTGYKTVGVVISVPGAYYDDIDSVNYDRIPEFRGLPLKKFFRERFKIENLVITHDVFAAAQAEYDAVKEENGSLFYFYVGEGVGGAYINRGTWHLGETLVAGEIGQMIVTDEDGESTLERAVAIPSLLDKVQSGHPGITFAQMTALYQQGDATVRKIIDDARLLIARVLYNTAWVLNPSCIVVDSNNHSFSMLIADACRQYNQKLQTLPIRMSLKIYAAQLNSYGEMQGCFHLGFNNWIEELSSESAES
jgi:predicted NBD/HSP70 family sugar kinase